MTKLDSKRYEIRVPGHVARGPVGVWLVADGDRYVVGIEPSRFERTLSAGLLLKQRLDLCRDLRAVLEEQGVDPGTRVVPAQDVYTSCGVMVATDGRGAVDVMTLSGYLAEGFIGKLGERWCSILERAESAVHWPETAREIDRCVRAWENLGQRWQSVSRQMRTIEKQFWQEVGAMCPNTVEEQQAAVRDVHQAASNVVPLETLFEAEKGLSDDGA